MRRMSSVSAFLLTTSIVASGLFLGSTAGSWAADQATDPYASLDSLAQAITLIETRYVNEVDPDDLVSAAIRGMTTSLDPHTRWLSPEETRALLQGAEGSYEGVGIETALVPEGVRVERVFAGGPSERAGLIPGDVITHSDGTDLAGLSDPAVTELLRGPRGEPVDLTIVRPEVAEPLVLRVVRDRIVTDPVEHAALGDIAYVRLMHFQRGAGDAVGEALSELIASGADGGVVLDLRDNPGGILDEAVIVVDQFLDSGTIVSTRGRTEAEEVHAATPGGIPAGIPVVVLVNHGSASASEIVAGALQDTERAVLMGADTYGKGSVQVLFDTSNGGSLKLTIALYYTPSGEPVAAGTGRVVDVPVAMDARTTALDELRIGIEQVENADERARLLTLLSQVAPQAASEAPVPWGVPVSERPEQDPQLARALAYLSGE